MGEWYPAPPPFDSGVFLLPGGEGTERLSQLAGQQRFWEILEYRVIDEETCTWVAKARQAYSLDAPEEEARVRVLLVCGFQSLVLDESVARKLFRP